MHESVFLHEAIRFLELLGDTIEELAHPSLEVDFWEEGLAIAYGSKQLLLNIHRPLRQIWFSSPVSGPSHFQLEQGIWVSTRDPQHHLKAVVLQDIQALIVSDRKAIGGPPSHSP